MKQTLFCIYALFFLTLSSCLARQCVVVRNVSIETHGETPLPLKENTVMSKVFIISDTRKLLFIQPNIIIMVVTEVSLLSTRSSTAKYFNSLTCFYTKLYIWYYTWNVINYFWSVGSKHSNLFLHIWAGTKMGRKINKSNH